MENEKIKAHLQQEAQIAKDRLIDNFIKLVNDFSLDWNRITAKLAEIKKEEENDKLNQK